MDIVRDGKHFITTLFHLENFEKQQRVEEIDQKSGDRMLGLKFDFAT